MRKPIPPMLKTASHLFADEVERAAFLEALLAGESREQAIIVLEDRPEIKTFPRMGALPWQPDFVQRIHEDFRPGRHPLHDKGAYYCLDLSSVFCASAMLALIEKPQRVLDVCAAPGGKSVFAWRAFRPEFMACNESIRKRASTLIANLERCKVENSIVWSADPSVWGRKFPGCFDLVLVDAPCSGQSLLAKGDDAPGCFTPQMVDMCVGRQRRIVGHAAKCLEAGGHLLYSTCTYAYQENEKVVAWLLEQYPWLRPIHVPRLAAYQSKMVDFPCYRLFPHQGIGAGGFVALLQRHDDGPEKTGDLTELKGWWKFGDVRSPSPDTRKPEEKVEPFKVPRKPRPRQHRPDEWRRPKPKKQRRGRNRPG